MLSIIYLTLTVVCLVLLAMATAWVRSFLRRPPRYRRRVGDDLAEFFQALLFRGYDKSFLLIEAPNKKRFIQFRKYIIKRENLGLEFGFPLAPWSQHYYREMEKLFYDRGIEYETRTTGENTVTAFLTVDLKQDVTKAMQLATLVLVEVFKLGANARIRVSVTNINPGLEKIGF
jgi:hypothetical protein